MKRGFVQKARHVNKQSSRQGQFTSNLDMGRVAAGRSVGVMQCHGRNVEMN